MQFFLRRGYVVATVEYRGPASGQFPAPVDDAKNAVRFLRKHADKYHVDPQRIGAWGMSMGAGVALMLAVTDDDFGTSKSGPYGQFSGRVQAVVDRYGPTDFTTFPLDLQSGFFMALSLGSTDPKSPRLRQASPLSHVSKRAAPVLVLHCRKDQVVPFHQSELFCAAMRKAGVASELREIHGGGHASEIAGQTPDDRAASDECRKAELAWFDQYLKRPN
jgi:acetyl esterase/lipase